MPRPPYLGRALLALLVWLPLTFQVALFVLMLAALNLNPAIGTCEETRR